MRNMAGSIAQVVRVFYQAQGSEIKSQYFKRKKEIKQAGSHLWPQTWYKTKKKKKKKMESDCWWTEKGVTLKDCVGRGWEWSPVQRKQPEVSLVTWRLKSGGSGTGVCVWWTSKETWRCGYQMRREPQLPIIAIKWLLSGETKLLQKWNIYELP
jgi:hypothetical protein